MKKKNVKEKMEKDVKVFEGNQKKESRWEMLIAKMFHYADDFSGIGQRVNFGSENHDVHKWLIQSGYPYHLTIERFQGLKMFMGILGLIVGGSALVLGLPFATFAVILSPLIGYAGTIIWIKNRAKKRQEELSYQLPDFLDTMSVTVQAGVGLDQALRDIVPYFEGPIKEEFGRFIQEMEVGVPRNEAYQYLLKRNDSEEFQLLIKSLIQGEQLGVPISDTFRQQSEEMRKVKKEKVKEKAAKASPKVTLITTFIIVPSSMLLIAGLMIINMFNQNRNIFQMFQ
ncbi:type II secretion system F family protein [Pontibacillus yanchengensis]|nr:type II secretion system F family protein [Pontibacillus yanchengensis]